jgi:hypothetical protein
MTLERYVTPGNLIRSEGLGMRDRRWLHSGGTVHPEYPFGEIPHLFQRS